MTIGKLIEAHKEGNEEKFNTYANFIKEAYEEHGEFRAAKIIDDKIKGIKHPPVILSDKLWQKAGSDNPITRKDVGIKPSKRNDGTESHLYG